MDLFWQGFEKRAGVVSALGKASVKVPQAIKSVGKSITTGAGKAVGKAKSSAQSAAKSIKETPSKMMGQFQAGQAQGEGISMKKFHQQRAQSKGIQFPEYQKQYANQIQHGMTAEKEMIRQYKPPMLKPPKIGKAEPLKTIQPKLPEEVKSKAIMDGAKNTAYTLLGGGAIGLGAATMLDEPSGV